MSKHCHTHPFLKYHHMCTPYDVESISAFCTICGLYMPSDRVKGLVAYRPNRFPQNETFRSNPQTILSDMISKQHKSRCFNKDALHVKYRPSLVKWLIGISYKLDFKQDTLHLSISILDAILSVFTVPENHVQMLTFIALYMAAKMEEKKHKLPSLDSVVDLFEGDFSIDEFKHCETVVLSSLAFDLNIVSPIKFVSYFSYRGSLFNNDFEFKIKYEQVETIKEGFSHFCEVFLKASLMSYELVRFSPLIVGCSVIALARKYLSCIQIWPSHLEDLTSVNKNRFQDCLSILEQCALNNFEDELDEFFSVFNRKIPLRNKRRSCSLSDDCSINGSGKGVYGKGRMRFSSEDNISTINEFSPNTRSISFS